MPAVWRRAVQNERGAEMQEMLISLAVALIAGLLMSRLAKLLRLPAVTAYLIGGLLIWLAVKKEYEPALLLPMGFGGLQTSFL